MRIITWNKIPISLTLFFNSTGKNWSNILMIGASNTCAFKKCTPSYLNGAQCWKCRRFWCIIHYFVSIVDILFLRPYTRSQNDSFFASNGLKYRIWSTVIPLKSNMIWTPASWVAGSYAPVSESNIPILHAWSIVYFPGSHFPVQVNNFIV